MGVGGLGSGRIGAQVRYCRGVQAVIALPRTAAARVPARAPPLPPNRVSLHPQPPTLQAMLARNPEERPTIHAVVAKFNALANETGCTLNSVTSTLRS